MTELRQRFRGFFSNEAFQSQPLRRWALAALFVALTTITLGLYLAPQRVVVVEGEPAAENIRAPRPVVNRVASERKVEEARRRVADQYSTDLTVAVKAEEQVYLLWNAIRSARGSSAEPAEQLAALRERLEQLRVEHQFILDVDDATLLAALGSTDDKAEGVAARLVVRLLSQAVTAQGVEGVRAQVDREPLLELADPAQRTLVRSTVKVLLRSNQVVDAAETERLRDLAAREVQPEQLKKGELIVGQGERVTHEHIVLLGDLGLIGDAPDYRSWVGSFLMAAVAVGLVGYYLRRFNPGLRISRLLLTGLVAAITLLLSLLAARAELPLLMPVALGSMLLTILIDARTAILVGIVLSLLVGAAERGSGDLSVPLVAAIGSVVGVFSVQRVEQRSEFIKAGLLVGLSNVVVTVALSQLQGRSLLEGALLLDLAWGLLGGIGSAVLAIGLLPFFETVFSVLTPVKLLELSNPTNPLLRRLMVEAPGTYHHTMLVANLAEAAAQAVGADALLTRVGSYYHDIGKVNRPYFFIENQLGGENPHDEIEPGLSALIIAGHVTDGVELARQQKLPKEIIDFIAEHHGTMLISYFYHKAKEASGADLDEADFRYLGPRPQSRETAILMLADGCEASVRAMRQRGALTTEQIEEQVRRIVRDRLDQGQLDASDLTLRDLETIAEVLIKVLSGAHHARIDYPQEALKQLGQGRAVSHAAPHRKRTDKGSSQPVANSPS